MVKSETPRDAEILVRNPSPRLFGKKFRDSKKVKTNHTKTRLRDLSKTLPRFRDPAKIFRNPRFSRYHSPPLFSLVLDFCVMVDSQSLDPGNEQGRDLALYILTKHTSQHTVHGSKLYCTILNVLSQIYCE